MRKAHRFSVKWGSGFPSQAERPKSSVVSDLVMLKLTVVVGAILLIVYF